MRNLIVSVATSALIVSSAFSAECTNVDTLFPMEEISGSIGNTLEVVNGRVNSAIKFDGKSYINKGDVENVGTGNFTIVSFVRTNAKRLSQSIIDKRENGKGYHLFLNSPGTSSSTIAFELNGVNFGSPNTAQINDNKWHCVAVSVERNSNRGGQLYIDGKSVHTFDPTVVNGDSTNGANLLIGGTQPNYSFSSNFEGIIDEVIFQGEALDEGNISCLCNNEARVEENDLPLIPLDDSTFTIEHKFEQEQAYLEPKLELSATNGIYENIQKNKLIPLTITSVNVKDTNLSANSDSVYFKQSGDFVYVGFTSSGQFTIKVEGYDLDGKVISSDKNFTTLANSAPIGNNADFNIKSNEVLKFDANTYFSDVDGDILSFSNTDPSKGKVQINDNIISYYPEKGTYSTSFTITATDTDINSGSATVTFSVNVEFVSDIEIAYGWNLLGNSLADKAINTFNILKEEEIIYRFTTNGFWEMSTTTNNSKYIKPKEGFWLKTKDDRYLSVTGENAFQSSTPKEIILGWNLLAESEDKALRNIKAGFEQVFVYDKKNNTWLNSTTNPNYILPMFQGYWGKVSTIKVIDDSGEVYNGDTNSESEFFNDIFNRPEGSTAVVGGQTYQKFYEPTLKGDGYWATPADDTATNSPENVTGLLIGDIEDLFNSDFINDFTNPNLTVKFPHPENPSFIVTVKRDDNGNWYIPTTTDEMTNSNLISLNEYIKNFDTSNIVEPIKSNIEAIKAVGGFKVKADGIFYELKGDSNSYYWQAVDGQTIRVDQYKYITNDLLSLPTTATLGDRAKIISDIFGTITASFKSVGGVSKWVVDGEVLAGEQISLVDTIMKSLDSSFTNNITIDLSGREIPCSGESCYFTLVGNINGEVVWSSADGHSIISSGNRDIATTYTPSSDGYSTFYLKQNDCNATSCYGDITNEYFNGSIVDTLFNYIFSTTGNNKNSLTDIIVLDDGNGNITSDISYAYDASPRPASIALADGRVATLGVDANGKEAYYINGELITKNNTLLDKVNYASFYNADGKVIFPSGITAENAIFEGDGNLYLRVVGDSTNDYFNAFLEQALPTGYKISLTITDSSGNATDFTSTMIENLGVYWEGANVVITAGDRSDLPIASDSNRINITKRLGTEDRYITTGGISDPDGEVGGVSYKGLNFAQWFYGTTGSVTNNMLDAVPESGTSNDISFAYNTSPKPPAVLLTNGDIAILGVDANGNEAYYINGELLTKNNTLLDKTNYASFYNAGGKVIFPNGITAENALFEGDGNLYLRVVGDSTNDYFNAFLEQGLPTGYKISLTIKDISNNATDFTSTMIENLGVYWEGANVVITSGDRSDLPVANDSNRINITKRLGTEDRYITTGGISDPDGQIGGVSYKGLNFAQWFYGTTGSVTNNMLDGFVVNANWGDENFEDVAFNTYGSFSISNVYIANNGIIGSVNSLGYQKYCYESVGFSISTCNGYASWIEYNTVYDTIYLSPVGSICTGPVRSTEIANCANYGNDVWYK